MGGCQTRGTIEFDLLFIIFFVYESDDENNNVTDKRTESDDCVIYFWDIFSLSLVCEYLLKAHLHL